MDKSTNTDKIEQIAKKPNTFKVKTGDPFKLNCVIEANPDPFKVRWLQNRKEVFGYTKQG